MSGGRRSRTPARSVVLLLRRERRRGRRYQPRFRLSQIAVTSLGALSAVALMALLSLWSGQPLIVAPLGASCVLLFGYPRSPLAQPRNLVLGNLLGGAIGVALVTFLGQGPLVLGLALGLATVVVIAGAGLVAVLNGGRETPAPQAAADHPGGDIEGSVRQLEAHLAEKPDDGEGWATLGWSYMRLARYDDAVAAYGKAVTLAPARADLFAEQGQALACPELIEPATSPWPALKHPMQIGASHHPAPVANVPYPAQLSIGAEGPTGFQRLAEASM